MTPEHRRAIDQAMAQIIIAGDWYTAAFSMRRRGSHHLVNILGRWLQIH
jgi:hypothetical protein